LQQQEEQLTLNIKAMSQKIRINLTGPIPLPTHKKIFTVLRSPHVNKKSREQFQLSSYKRLLDIYSSSSKTIDALMKLELPSGVEVEIKV
jgi:small subunit ribosomal protein S10